MKLTRVTNAHLAGPRNMPALNKTGIRYRVARRTKPAPDGKWTVPEHSGNAEDLEGFQGFSEAQRRKNSGEAPARIVFDPWADHVI